MWNRREDAEHDVLSASGLVEEQHPRLLPAFAEVFDVPECKYCIKQQGLCKKHSTGILPQLAKNIGWLKMMGLIRVEQKRLQAKKDLPVSEQQAEHKKRKAQAKSNAKRKQRRHEKRKQRRLAEFAAHIGLKVAA